jgi:AraC-like DNA-binding protein
VLHQALAAERFTLARYEPRAVLAPFVDFVWVLHWDLRGQEPHEQTILPHPNVNLGFEATGAGIFGVDRRLFTRTLTGRGKALGVRFRPGGFRPFWQAPVSQLTDRVVPAVQLFGPAADHSRKLIMDAETDQEMIALAETLLTAALPGPDPAADRSAQLVALITGDQGLRRVDQLADASGLAVRAVQRLFADYVGVSPKWVMRRSRLHEAALRADSGEPVDWGQLALDLGYADQTHLTRDFTATLGVSPTRYARLLAARAASHRLDGVLRFAQPGSGDVAVDLDGLDRLAAPQRLVERLWQTAKAVVDGECRIRVDAHALEQIVDLAF